ncbi:Thiol:disulfide interchange protein [Mycoavidus cysteinexigens]|uniref:Thiol:disulfide interchange protein n=1 Tax=Mycoavidus cysteinexigens TaxID=1553431 RepID=A0A2Z6EY61_9BURK|nr:thiol:disulfide interchange protein DsbA/DsbL [Mycoavidus cysteinexigens]BBE10370.1 Thiol:disulfide interchange protein [Mycoavidus cysteinexigens]GLR00787.1 thiol:disulfide interchange protein [Mycoavidus cysteinexigens]
MKKSLSVLLAFIFFAVSGVYASTLTPQAGKHYKVLKTPQAVSVPAGKIEVIEFFWYGCPHCKDFDPLIEAWASKQGPDVVFKRVPIAFDASLEVYQKLYHALDKLGVATQMAPKIFKAIHVDRNYLKTTEAQAEFVAQHGVDKKKFLEIYHSFSTAAEVQRDNKLMVDYNLTGVPALAVQGKYEVSPALTNSLEGVMPVLDFVIAQIRAKKM